MYTKRRGGGRTLGIIATAVGGSALVTGTALLPIGIAKDIDAMTAAGGIPLGTGAVLLTLGILALRATADTYQPGSSNHFAPGP